MAPSSTPVLANAQPPAWAHLAYGLLGFPLAFVALPLYVHLPPHLAGTLGWSLAATGGVLLAVRVFDALIDPALGRWSDRLLARSPRHLLVAAGVAAVAVVLGLAALFTPGWSAPAAVVVLALLLAGCANSLLTIAHQAWGAALAKTDAQRSHLFAWREGAGLAGVLVASALPAWLGWDWTLAVLAFAMATGWLAWCRAQRPMAVAAAQAVDSAHSPWRNASFRRLMGVFVLNGVAGAIPATLVVLYMTDRLGANPNWQAGLLATYFASAALGLPVWLRAVRAWGLAPAWLVGMVLAVLAFATAAWLGHGEVWGFAVVCALSGLTLGADLALPSALLAQVLDRSPSAQAHRGLYFGWWALAAKLNLALAAGLALPLLQLWGYQPGTAQPNGLAALAWAYSGWPCVLKLAAATWLYAGFIRHAPHHTPLPTPSQANP